jgi:hypothetical protein
MGPAATPKMRTNQRKQKRKLGNRETAEDITEHNQPETNNNKGCLGKENSKQSAKPSNLPSDNSKQSPLEPPIVPEWDMEKQNETESDSYADVDLGWQWLHNPNDPIWVKENEAMNKVIDDLDDMFMTYGSETTRR